MFLSASHTHPLSLKHTLPFLHSLSHTHTLSHTQSLSVYVSVSVSVCLSYTLSLQAAEALMSCVRMGWMGILIGPPASGKTTLVRALVPTPLKSMIIDLRFMRGSVKFRRFWSLFAEKSDMNLSGWGGWAF